MPPKKSSSTRSASKAPAATTKTTSPRTTRHLVIGVSVILLGFLAAKYLVLGVYLYLTDATGGYFTAATAVFNYLAALTTLPGYFWWAFGAFVVTAIMVLALLRLVFIFLFRPAHPVRQTGITAGVFVVALLAAIFLLPPFTNSVVGYHAFLARYDALKHFDDKQQELAKQQGASQPSASKDDMRAQALQQLVLADAIRQEAWKYDVTVSSKEIDDSYKQYVDRNQGEDNLRKQLKDLLGWEPEQFKEEIRIKLLEEKLNQKLTSDDEANKDRRQKAEDLLKQVKQDKKDFVEVAKQSDDPAAQTGADPGYVKKGESDPAIDAVVFTMNVGDISDVIKTANGYVIVKVEDKKDDTVKVRQILVRTKSLQDVLPADLRDAHISIYVKNLVWDENLTAVTSKASSTQNEPAPTQASAAPGAETTTAPVSSPSVQ